MTRGTSSSRTTKRIIRKSAHPSTIEVNGTSIATAHNLPAEVLSMIFRETIQLIGLPLLAPGCSQHSPGWFVLMWICSRWRNILLADAAVWATCYCHYPKLQQDFLTRACMVPLVYRLTAYEPRISPHSGMFGSDERALAQFFAATPLEKCVEIYVSDGRGTGIADYIFELASASSDQPLKHLRRLHLETWHWQWNGLRADVLTKGHGAFVIAADNLEDVHFQNCWTVVSSPAIRRLTVIFEANYLTRPSIRVFYHAMSVLSGNALTHLELTNPVGCSYRVDMREYQLHPILLPALKTMNLTGYAAHLSNVLSIIVWPRDKTRLSVRAVVGDGPQQSLYDEQQILHLCLPVSNQGRFRALSIEHTIHGILADRITLRFWKEWSSQDRISTEPDTTISFGGAYMPCMWYDTAIASIQANGNIDIELFVLALLASDYDDEDIPWERLFLVMPSIKALSPWRQILDSIGQVDSTHLLGTSFRTRVHDFDLL